MSSFIRPLKKNLKVLLWSWHQDSNDWKRPGEHKIINHVLNNVRPGDVVLFHDGGGERTQTVKALKTIIPALKEEGFELVTVSELISRIAYKLD